MLHCVACQGDGNPDLSYFTFPLEANRKAEWCHNLQVSPSAVTSKHRVCEKHFRSNQFTMNTKVKRLRKDAFPIPSILTAPSTASLPQLCNPITSDNESSPLSITTTRFTRIQPRYATQPTPTPIPGNSRSEPIVAPAPVYSTFTSVPAIGPSSTLQWVLVPQQPLLVLNTSSVELDSRRNEGMNKNKRESVLFPVEKTTNARRTLHNVLNWLRKVNGNQLPDEVFQLLHPIFLTEPEPEGKSSVRNDESADEIKEEIKSEHSYSAPGSPTQSVEDSYLRYSSAEKQLVDILGQENEHRPVSHKCPYCDQGFDSMVELSKHSLVHCSLPLARVRGKSVPRGRIKEGLRNLPTRMRIKFKGSGGAYYHTPCPQCNENFTIQDKLWQHIRKNHPGHRMFKCDICEKGFYTPGELMKHRRRHTTVKREPKYTPCPQCNEKFTNQKNLWTHVQENHPDHRMFKCDICEQGFHASSGLWMHRRTIHATEKQEHKCTFCEKTFRFTHYLKKHINAVHNKRGKYKCPDCPYACENTSLLSQHIDVHFGRNLKKCPHCGSLIPKNNIKKHIEQVHLGKRHKCNLCGCVFHQTAMRGHMLLKHPDVRNPILSECYSVVFVEPNHGQKRKRLEPPKKRDKRIREVRNRNERKTNPTLLPPPEPPTTEDGTTDITLPNGKNVEVRYKVVDQIEEYTPFRREKHSLIAPIRDATRKTKYPDPDRQIARQRRKFLRTCALCNNHPFKGWQSWTEHKAKHERDPNYRITPRLSVRRLVDSANDDFKPTTTQGADSSVTDKCQPTSISEQASESGLESENKPSSTKVSSTESSCPIPDLNQAEVTTDGCTENAHPIEGSVSKKAVKMKKSVMMFKCPYETCTEPTGEWVPWANLKEHLVSSHPEETGSGNGKRIRLNYSKPKPGQQPKPKEKVPRNAKIPCPQCEKVVRADYMPIHIKYVHNNKLRPKTVCHQCGKVVYKVNFLKHIQHVHNKLQPKTVVCPQCEKVVRASYMRAHLISHNKVKTVCPKCGKLIAATHIVTHLRLVHNEVQSIPLECKICNKTFQHKLHLKNHLKTINHRKLAAEKTTVEVEDATRIPELAAASESHKSCE